MENSKFLHVWEETQNDFIYKQLRAFVSLFQSKKERHHLNVTPAIKKLIFKVKLVFLVCD